MSIILITAALVFYTTGVWAERRQGVLRPWHVVMFALGLLCDASGTWFMARIAASGYDPGTGAAGAMNQIMQVTGGLALILMAIHLVWAIVVLLRNRPDELSTFHRLSVVVWAIWLIPYFTGMVGSMMG